MLFSFSNKRRNTFLCFAVLLFSLLISGCNKRHIETQHLDQNSTAIEPSVRLLSAKEKQQFNNWIVREMYEQIYGRKAKSAEELYNWSNVLNQGGSLEGVYHGMILSKEYAELEHGKASIAAVRFFSEEFSQLETGKPSPALAEKVARKAMEYSLFSLKRQLGELLLDEIQKKKDDRPALAKFYGNLTARWAEKGVAFGLADRNRADPDFHAEWARKNSIGMIEWEVLNRMHRIFNQYGGIILDGK